MKILACINNQAMSLVAAQIDSSAFQGRCIARVYTQPLRFLLSSTCLRPSSQVTLSILKKPPRDSDHEEQGHTMKARRIRVLPQLGCGRGHELSLNNIISNGVATDRRRRLSDCQSELHHPGRHRLGQQPM